MSIHDDLVYWKALALSRNEENAALKAELEKERLFYAECEAELTLLQSTLKSQEPLGNACVNQCEWQCTCGVTKPLFTAPQPAVPAGYKLVPVEPTEGMIAAMVAVWISKSPTCGASSIAMEEYKAMLSAAPEAPQDKDGERYRWLINACNDELIYRVFRILSMKDDIDTAIDAAMKESK